MCYLNNGNPGIAPKQPRNLRLVAMLKYPFNDRHALRRFINNIGLRNIPKQWTDYLKFVFHTAIIALLSILRHLRQWPVMPLHNLLLNFGAGAAVFETRHFFDNLRHLGLPLIGRVGLHVKRLGDLAVY